MSMENFMQWFSWIFVALSLAGNIFVIKKNVVGQWIWALSNIGWISFDLYIGAYSQAFLFAVYFGLCVWGIISWTKEAKVTKQLA